jgi:uncharacterized protein
MDVLSFFWGIVLRTAQAFIEASPTLACGFLIAGILRMVAGTEGIRRLFGSGGFRSLVRAWAIGMLLPVCSLGVIPIARELCRAGVRSGTVVAFVLSAPHINPISLLYGLTLSEPVVILCFAAASLVISLSAGAAWDAFFTDRGRTVTPLEEHLPAPGLKRMAAVLIAAARESIGPSLAYCLLGVLGTGLLAAVIPFGALQHAMSHSDPVAPLFMTAIALPAYNAPLQGMMKLGLMFEHGNSVGAAFSLFELGIGVNLGLVVWLAGVFGTRRVLLWLALLTLVVIGFAYAAEPTLYFAKEEVDHTHALDDLSAPFPTGTSVTIDAVAGKLGQKLGGLESASLAVLALLMLLGGADWLVHRRWDVDAWLVRRPPSSDKPKPFWDRPIPGPVLAIVALLGLVAFSVIAAYVYYPDPEQVFRDMAEVRVEAITAVRFGHKEEAIRRLEQWDLLTRKLQVGDYIRGWQLDKAKADKADDLREELEKVRDDLLAGRLQEAKEKVRASGPVDLAYFECQEAFTGRPPPPGIRRVADDRQELPR